MRCPSCNAENDKEAARCGACGVALAKKAKRRGGGQVEAGSPFAWPAEPVNKSCVRAYWVACAGLIPGVGLVLGPVAVVLGLAARAQAKADPECTAQPQASAAILFGTFITVTNWLGLGLMILGWRGVAP